MSDLNAAQIAAQWGNRARFFDQFGSTNDAALAWLTDGAPDGAFVVADEQTQGRGRLGRAWYSPPDSALMLSFIVRPAPEHVTRLSMVGALAVYDAVATLKCDASALGLKWPNDVQYTGRKLCGVLPEAAWEGDQLRGAVLGIGINVRVDFSGTPYAETAISLQPALGEPVDRGELLRQLIERLDHWTARIGSPVLLARWRERLTMLGQRVDVRVGDALISGIAQDVDDDGALLLRDDAGTTRRILAGDVTPP